MKILFVVAYVPNPIRVRPYNLVRQLAARGHQVTVATVWTTPREREELDALVRCGIRVVETPLPRWRSMLNCVLALPGPDPLQAWYSWSPALLASAAEFANRTDVDVVHVEHLRGAQYGFALRQLLRPEIPIVWDSVDSITHLFEQAVRNRKDRVGRLINQLEVSRTRQFERGAVPRFDRVLVSSTVDRQALVQLAQDADRTASETRVTVLTNGVDVDYFTPAREPRSADTLVFSGKMSYHANEAAVLHLVNEVMPAIWAERPRTRLVVAGKDPSPRLQRVMAAGPDRLVLTGTVDDIRPYLAQAAVAVVPLVYGAGCQNKVLEAMACGTPVVVTPQAVSALQAVAGRDLCVAGTPREFAQAVLALLNDRELRDSVGAAGRRYVENHHRWEQVAGQLESIYGEAITARSGDDYAAGRALLTA